MQRLAAIMAGGSGERFWPVSRTHRPKQLLNLASPDRSLLSEAVDRVVPLAGMENVFVLTGRPIEADVRAARVVPSENVIAEPAKRNTLGCLCWFAAKLLASGRPDATIAVLTADHKIGEAPLFRHVLESAYRCAEIEGGLVTLGIKPTRPETGYGYIELAEGGADGDGLKRVASFCEKPNAQDAQAYVDSGRFLWNSGMFVWTLAAFMRELERAQPVAARLTLAISDALAAGNPAEAEARFLDLPSISIDYALMEKAKMVHVVEATFPWDDVGAWDSLLRTLPADASGNAAYGSALLEDCDDCVVYNDDPSSVACVLGVQDVIVVVTKDAVLVCPKDRAQEVRTFVQKLKESGDPRV